MNTPQTETPPRPAVLRTRIKICGLTREQDVDAAVAAGADAIGFVLYPKSPRYVTPERAAELARRLPETAAELHRIPGLPPTTRQRLGETLLEHIAIARLEPPEQWPTLPHRLPTGAVTVRS